MTRHWLTGLALCMLFLGVATPIAAQDGAALQDGPAMEAFFDGLMAAHLEAHHIPGAVVAVVADGETVFTKGYGYADVENRVAPDPEGTLFRPGSVAKLVTWTAVMQLVEAGKIDLHADVSRYLDFELPRHSEPITLAHLLTHTAGFEDHVQALFVMDEGDLVSLEEYVKNTRLDRVYPPGEVGAYSNYGAALAGYIVQRVSGEPFETYVERHILEPLGMARSTFRQPLPPQLAGDLAQGYGYARGEFVPGEFELVSASAAGSMSTTAADMARFMIAHLQGGQPGTARILQPETAARMHTTLWSPDPRVPGMGYGFILNERNGRRIAQHGGSTLLFHSGLYLFPEDNAGLFVSYNSSGGALAREELMNAFVDRYFPAPPPAPVEPPADFSARTQALAIAGEYHPARANFSSIEKLLMLLQAVPLTVDPDGYLLVSLGRPGQYVEVEPGLYRHRIEENMIIVQTNAEGRAETIIPADVPVMTLHKAPFYATRGFAGLLAGGGLLLFLLSLLGWAVAHVARRGARAGEPSSLVARLARWTAVALVALAFLFVALFATALAIAPAYGVPPILLEREPGLGIFPLVTLLMAVAAGAMGLLALAVWLRREWGWFGRLHYTLLALIALGWVWLLVYWNLLGAAL